MAIDTGVLQAPRGRRSRAATSAPTTTRSCTTTARSTIKHGRGSVLTVDLTNRCNMMCDPCFMDANQVGFVHELTLGRHQEAARQRDHASSRAGRCRCSSPAASRRSRRTSSTRSATRARSATTACRRRPTASSSPRARSSRKQAAEAGLRYAYLQFDGIGNAANAHRQRRQPVRREAARDREPAQRRRRHRPGRHDRQRRQQRAGRPRSSSSRSTTRRRSTSCRSSRCRSPAATRTSPTSAARRSATRCRTWRTT